MSLVAAPSFGERLKSRRQRLGVSQLQLAVDAGVSARHLSFIETGRSRPSREMVLRLAERLRLPLRDQNGLLLAAGFAPAFPQHDLAAPELGAVRRAASLVLANHEPFPAIAIDRRRNVVMSNRAAQRLLGELPRELSEPALNSDFPAGPRGAVADLLDTIHDGLATLSARPTLLVRAGKDAVFGRDAFAAFLADFPRAEVLEVAQAGHFVQEDAHEIVVPALLEFLSRQRAPTSSAGSLVTFRSGPEGRLSRLAPSE